jgi:uncharacterized membrane protein
VPFCLSPVLLGGVGSIALVVMLRFKMAMTGMRVTRTCSSMRIVGLRSLGRMVRVLAASPVAEIVVAGDTLETPWVRLGV